MKKREFLRNVEELSNKFSGEVFADKIWIGRVVAERFSEQDEVSRADVINDLKSLLQEHADHPSFSKSISKALKELGE